MKVQLKNNEKDQTRELRDIIENAPKGTKIQFEGKALTHGMLPEDLEKEFFNPGGQSLGFIGDVGTARILTIKDKEKLQLTGGEFINPKETFTEETRPDRRAKNVSVNSFLHIVNSKEISITDLSFTGPHTTLRDTGFPQFYGSKEFEHFIELEGGEKIFLKNLDVKNIYGDFLYFKSANPINSYVTVKDCIVYFNGRQGVAWGDGQNILIDSLRVELSGRGGADFEPPRESYHVNNVIIRNSHFKTWLLPVPMGGRGIVENILIENNENETNSPQTFLGGDRVSTIRRNIIFRGNKSLAGYGSIQANYQFQGVENLLIENEETIVSPRRSLEAIELTNCRNVTIRNNDFVNAKYIVLRDTPIEEVKVYGNKQNLKFKVFSFEMPFKEAPYVFSSEFHDEWRDRVDFGLYKKAEKEWKDYMVERNKTATYEIVDIEEYDVEKYGEPDIPKDPEFIPYMGVDTVVAEPKPEVPEAPKEDPAPIPESPEEKPVEKTKIPIYKKTWFVAAAIAVVLILTALILT